MVSAPPIVVGKALCPFHLAKVNAASGRQDVRYDGDTAIQQQFVRFHCSGGVGGFNEDSCLHLFCDFFGDHSLQGFRYQHIAVTGKQLFVGDRLGIREVFQATFLLAVFQKLVNVQAFFSVDATVDFADGNDLAACVVKRLGSD